MPSFRDLKGKPVEDVVTSRGVVPHDGLLDDPVVTDDDDTEVPEVPVRILRAEPAPPSVPALRSRVSDDFETLLLSLESTLDSIEQNIRIAREQMADLRTRAELDAGRLAKIDEMVKALTIGAP